MSDQAADPARVTALIEDARAGKAEALDALLPLVYAELRRVAGAYVRRERPGQTLQATGLVHEAYLRLMRDRNVHWQNRALLRHRRQRDAADPGRAGAGARRHQARRRLGPHDAERRHRGRPRGRGRVEVLDQALARLAERDPDQARLVELRYFGGLTIEETADVPASRQPPSSDRGWWRARG